MSPTRTAFLPALLALFALLGGAGCGDDEQAEALPEPPKLTVPRTTPEPDPPTTAPAPTAPTETETEETAPAPGGGGDPSTAPLAPGEGDGTSEPPTGGTSDGPANDTAPPAGSPAERFERECDADPAACG
jgi:hypothetical protein